MLGPGRLKGFSAVGRHQEEAREALAEVAWVRLLLASGGGDLKHQWHQYDDILWFKAHAGETNSRETGDLLGARTNTDRLCQEDL